MLYLRDSCVAIGFMKIRVSAGWNAHDSSSLALAWECKTPGYPSTALSCVEHGGSWADGGGKTQTVLFMGVHLIQILLKTCSSGGYSCCSVTGDFWLAGICWCCTCSKAASPVQWGNSGLCSIQALSVSISLLHISSGVSKGCLRFPLQKFEECLKVKMWDRQKKSIYVTYL